MTVDFRELADKPLDDVQRPPVLPAGTYHGRVKSTEWDDKNKNKTPYLQVNLSLDGPGEDVNAEELEGIDLSKRTLNKKFYITDDSTFRLKDFLKSCNIQVEGVKLGQAVAELTNAPVLIEVTHQPNRDKPEEPPFAMVDSLTGDNS